MRGSNAKNYVATSGEANFPEQRPKPCRVPLSPGTRAEAKPHAMIGHCGSALLYRLNVGSPQPQLPHAIVGQRTAICSDKAFNNLTVIVRAASRKGCGHSYL
jgi:hypothetical protein